LNCRMEYIPLVTEITIIYPLIVVLANIGDIIAYRHGLHFCEEVYPHTNRN
jgi:hypothetical protein